MSLQTLRVLEAFLANSAEQLSGADPQRHADLASGTLYPFSLDSKPSAGSSAVGKLSTRQAPAVRAGGSIA
jgi:hypothetical protein